MFSSVRGGGRAEYQAAAGAVGAEMGRRGMHLLHGGGTVGLMGTIARAVDEAGLDVVRVSVLLCCSSILKGVFSVYFARDGSCTRQLSL